jgi:hypothetical protein
MNGILLEDVALSRCAKAGAEVAIPLLTCFRSKVGAQLLRSSPDLFGSC